MNFCSNCDNLFSIVGNDEKLELVCKTCGNTKEITEPFSLLEKKYVPNKELYKEVFVNDFVYEDKTLPAIKKECPSCKTDDKVVFMKYDSEEVKYIYCCKNCNTSF
jgi:DNA-directed RNA polymerase subunit M/transcription elongation factor TFIIS